jgi:hypothetical protein
VLAGEHFPGPSDTGLHLVGNQQNPVAITESAKVGQVAVGRNDIATFALDRLHEDGRDIVGIQVPREQVLLDDRNAAAVAGRFPATELTPVPVGEGDVMNVGKERPEAGVLSCLAGGESDGTGGTAMKRTSERYDGGAASGVTGELDRRLDGFGP